MRSIRMGLSPWTLVLAQEYAVSHGAYLLEEASYHKFDCICEETFAFKLHMQKPRLNPQNQPRLKAHCILAVPWYHSFYGT